MSETPALLHIGTEVEAAVEEAFNRWCEGHLLANLDLPGFVSARRLARDTSYPGVGESPRYLTLYDLEDPAALASDAYRSHDQSVPAEFLGGMSFRRSVYREIAVHGSRGVRGAAILHVTVDVEPAHDRDFLEWYAGEHVPAVLEAPGMLAATRFESAEPEPAGTRHYCTIYEMEDPGVIGRPEMNEAARKGACPSDLEPHRKAFNHIYDEIFRCPG